jgi:ligand-binding sensor domain-containing protein
MNIHLHPYILICLLFTIKNCPAQTEQVKFNLVTGSNGISLGTINGMTRDRQGVMWFSDEDHQCLIRYDGTFMTSFPHDPKDSNSLGGRYPECLFADSSGNIWIGFNGTGLDRFNPETNTFTHFRHQSNDTGSLANDIVFALQVDHLGNLWVGTLSGLDLFNQKTGKFRHFRNNVHDSTSLSDSIVRTIYEDREGILWIGTGLPWSEPFERGGLNRFNREKETFTRYLNDPKNPHSLINNKVRAIFEDSRHIFWVGTAGDGLHSMDRKTGVFERHTFNPAKPEQLSRPPVVNNIGDHITFITEDALGYLWIGTFGNGINRYDTLAKTVTHFGGNADRSGSFKDNNCWWANASGDGLIWLSTQEPNLYKIDFFTNNIPHYETNIGMVHSFYEETANILWLGADSGLIRKDLKTGTSRRFLHELRNPDSNNSGIIGTIIKDGQGDFLLGTLGKGIIRFNPNTGKYSLFQHDPKNNESLRNDYVTTIYKDSQSNFFVATLDGLDRMNQNSGTFVHYHHSQMDSNILSSNQVISILEEEADVFWVGGYYTGIHKMNLQTGKVKLYLPGAFVTSIFKDAKGVIWVGASNGLYRYNKKTDDFLIFTEEITGIKINSVSSIIGDDGDNLWVASLPGIYRINSKRDQVIIYDRKNGIDGFASQIYWPVSAYKGRDGEIFFSGSTGYYAFYPDKLKVPTGVPRIELSKFWLKGLDVKVSPESPLTGPLSRTKEIHLKHDQNVFSISFTAIDYGYPGDKTFYYKLENYDDDWRLSGADEKAYYFNVPPGKYVFKVKVSNIANGASVEKDIVIIIAVPWWQTWWAYTLDLLLVVMAVIVIDRIQKKRVIKKVREQGRERELEMQALRAQMNPHFIFNCLSSINNFVMNNETEEASDYLTKFSRLIRNVLTNSKKPYVSLEEELETLILYLGMEKLRFKDTFRYCIHIDTNIDPSAIFIPPLLFQPFAENAVWHGLLHKADPGRLDINLSVENKVLICIIEDNGVGRSFVRASEGKSVEKRKSMGIQITRQRLSLINGNAEIAGNDFVIEDLFDDTGRAAGTRVRLRLLYKEINDEIY